MCILCTIKHNRISESGPYLQKALRLSAETRGFPSGSAVKNLPAMQEMQFWSLSWKDPREKYMATHPSILAWRIPWTEEPGGLQFIKSQRVRHDWSNIAGMHTWTRLWELLGHLCDSCLTSICLGINRT